MPTSAQSKYILEQIHIDHLCSILDLERFDPKNNSHNASAFYNGKPDLVSSIDPKIFFELKTRIFPQEQEGKRYRPKHDHTWWRVDTSQIRKYQSAIDNHEVDIYWMFLIATMNKQPCRMDIISEEDIIKRELYLLPWQAHTLAASAQRQYINVGLGKICSEYEFNRFKVDNTEVFISSEIPHKRLQLFMQYYNE